MIKGNDGLSIGRRIALRRLNSKDKKSYPSQILDILDEEKIVISGPIYKNKIVLVHTEDVLEVSYMLEEKGRYFFNAKVLRRELRRIYKLELKKISHIKRQQLRRYYRFEVDIPVTKELVIKIGDERKTVTENCRTKDISGGGLRLYSNQKHEIGDMVLCKFNIDDHQIVSKGKILRIENVDTFEYDYALGIKFVKIEEIDRDRIIKFIFSKQRLLREKGLI